MLSDFPAMVSGKVVAVHGGVQEWIAEHREEIRYFVTRGGAVFLVLTVLLTVLIALSIRAERQLATAENIRTWQRAQPYFLDPN